MHIHLAAVLRKKGKNFAPILAGIRAYRDAVPAITLAAKGKFPRKPRVAVNHFRAERREHSKLKGEACFVGIIAWLPSGLNLDAHVEGASLKDVIKENLIAEQIVIDS